MGYYKRQYSFVKEVMRICKNAIFTYPTPLHPTFSDDIGHHEVIVDFYKLGFDFIDKSTKTGRSIYIVTSEPHYWNKGKLYKVV